MKPSFLPFPALLLLIQACAVAQIREPAGPLEGGWHLVKIACESGELSDAGKKYNEKLLNGKEALVVSLEGGDAWITVFSYAPEGKNRDRCETYLEEKWKSSELDKLSTSQTHGSSIRVGSIDPADCPKETRDDSERMHSYLQENRSLTLTAIKGSFFPGDHKPFCVESHEKITFERVL